MKTLVNKSLEAAINRYLSLDPESYTRLLALDGKILTIELQAISMTIPLKIECGKMQVLQEVPDNADVVIKGTPLSLLHMSISKDRKQFFADDVCIEGNLELGQQIIDLFDEMEIDWEEYISQIVGDVPAHQFGRFVQGIKGMTARVRESLFQNMNEYVHEEATLFPPKEALHDFFNDIDILRMDADRLEARMKRLQKMREDFE